MRTIKTIVRHADRARRRRAGGHRDASRAICARRQELDYGFEDVDREIQHIVAQMTDEELRAYLKESLFMSFNRFENDRLVNRRRRTRARRPRTDEQDRAEELERRA